MKILLNAVSVKKRGGGVFQIAINFIIKTIEQYSREIEWFYIVSEDLDEVIHHKLANQKNYYVFPTQPDFTGSYFKVKKELKFLEKSIKPNVVYSLASPSYFSFDAPEVMRFANAWVTNPNKYANSKLSFFKRLKNELHFLIQKKLMRRCEYFITQSNTVKEGILSIVDTKPENVKVVPNVLPAFFRDINRSLVLNQENNKGFIYIACVAVPSKHKNLDILPKVIKILREKHSITKAVFLTTIPEDSKSLMQIKNELSSLGLSDHIINYGYCTQAELVDLYSKCELCFFPSLLETFSATLLEAMFFNLAIVATDLGFNKEVVGDSALYFRPMDAEDAADNIAFLIKNPDKRDELKSKMSSYLDNYSNFDQYMDSTINFLKDVAEKK